MDVERQQGAEQSKDPRGDGIEAMLPGGNRDQHSAARCGA
jgi:hypothetical protein